MTYIKTLLLLSLCLLLSGCNADKKNTSLSKASNTTIPQVSSVKLSILINDLRIREQPNPASKVITKVSENDTVVWKGEVSTNHNKIKLRSVIFNTPWIKITSSDGSEGWLYSAAAKADAVRNSLNDKFNQIRRDSFFGTKLSAQIEQYQKDYFAADTDKKFAMAYQTGQQLRDEMVDILEKKAEVGSPHEMDMTWLEQIMPGYTLTYAAEGTKYYLLADFKKMQLQTSKTKGKADDDFLQLANRIYDNDQKESFFYSWFEQTWDYGGESLLGQGKHLDILNQLSKFAKKTRLFAEQIKQYKSDLINDIANKENTFKEPKSKRKLELEKIIKQKPSILDAGDIAILKTVLKNL